jgi:amino acid transporter
LGSILILETEKGNQPEAANKSGGLASEGTLGTFAGVFTPSILTILGIILFLRLGFVVGNAGLGRALLILALANGISVLTTVSLSAIATNLKVKGGGDYYLISRTLGLEFGGAIGIVLFLAQSVSIAFYCIGFGEVLAVLLPFTVRALPQLIAALAVMLLFVFAWLGADWATRFQYVVMGILAASLTSFFIGGLLAWDNANLVANWSVPQDSLNFWVVFAIFFPAVTGFTQGVSMSGDLKDAGHSLPLGTFLAVGVSIVVYFLAALTLAASLPNETLQHDYSAMGRVAIVTPLITAGVIAATLSSAMASFLGAPRILQSLARDRIFPFLTPFAAGVGPAGNPRRGVLLSAGIAFATIGLGNLNLVAPIVSMFFLISYGLLNYATFFEARAASPSFRPRFRFYDAKLSLLGGLACLGVILAIDLTAGVVALAVLFAVYQYVSRTAGPARWADSRRSYNLQQTRKHLLAAETEAQHPRDWRPHLMAFSDQRERRDVLLYFASWIQGQSGFTTVVRLLEGEGVKMLKLKAEAEAEIQADIKKRELEAFHLVIVTAQLDLALETLVQSFGIGPVRANTVLLNWFAPVPAGSPEVSTNRLGSRLRTAFRYGLNIILLNATPEKWSSLQAAPDDQRRIDVWWWGDASSRLMLLLAYLVTRSASWNDAKIRVLDVSAAEDPEITVEDLHQTLEEVRIEAEPEVVAAVSADAVAAYSSDAALVFLPFRLKENQPLDPFGEPLDQILTRLPVTAVVLAAEDIDLDAQPEEGTAGDIASALDALADAEKKAKQTERDAAKTAEEAQTAQANLARYTAEVNTAGDETTLSKMAEAAQKAGQVAEKAARRAAKALAKVDDAVRALKALGVEAPGKSGAHAEELEPQKEVPPKLP